MHTLRVAIIFGNNESIINAGIEMEELREAAYYGGFLDNALSREFSQAMADALAMFGNKKISVEHFNLQLVHRVLGCWLTCKVELQII